MASVKSAPYVVILVTFLFNSKSIDGQEFSD